MTEEWAPKTRDDWTDLFADGITKAIAKEHEAAAKAGQNKPSEPDPKDKTDPPKRTFREMLLGA